MTNLFIMLAALALATLFAPWAYAAEPVLPDLPELRLNLADGSCVILAPQAAPYAEMAANLASALKKRVGADPKVVSDTTDPATLGKGPLVLLGNLMDNAAVRMLYFHAYDFTDLAFPGPEGHVARTIRDPFGTGAHVLLLGGSYPDGVAAAAAWLAERVHANGPELGYMNKVSLGEFAADIRSYTEPYLTMPETEWPHVGGCGSWDYMIAIAKAGLGYLRTGDEAYLPVFKREMFYFLDHDVYHPTGEAHQMIHGFVHTLLLVWDLIRDHPAFTPDDRRRIDEGFLYIARSGEGPKRLTGALPRQVIRGNHGTRAGLDAYFLSRFFGRRFGLDEAQVWRDTAAQYFAPQLGSAKPICDSWGHQWSASLFNTLVYAMAADKQDYFQNQAFRAAADRALVAHGNAGPAAYLAACAVAVGDPGYLSLQSRRTDYVRKRAAMHTTDDEYLRAFCASGPGTPRKDLLGVTVAPVDTLWYDTIDAAGFNPGGLFVRNVPIEDCFDKVSIRENFGPDGYYLLLDGIAGGHHSYQDANCLVWYQEGGVRWWQPSGKLGGAKTIRQHNCVFVALNAEGPGAIHRYSRLLYAESHGGCHAVAGALEGVGPVDWERHVLRKTGAWTLVIDRVVPHAAGELLAERYWHVDGEGTARPDGLISAAKANDSMVYLHLQTAGIAPEAMSGTNPRIERLVAEVAAEARVEFATLLSVSDSADAPRYVLEQTKAGWRVTARDGTQPATVTVVEDEAGRRGLRVTDGENVVLFGAPGDVTTHAHGDVTFLPPEPAVRRMALAWVQVLPPGQEGISAVAVQGNGIAVGMQTGTVAFVQADPGAACIERWRAGFQSPILSLHVLPSGQVLVGEERGAVSCVEPDGAVAWTVEIPYVVMPWAHWSEFKSRIRELDAADLNGDGIPEVLLSNSDRRVYAFSLEGEQLWKRPIEWGIFTAMTSTTRSTTRSTSRTVGTYQGEWALMGGTSRPSIHGRCIVLGSGGKPRAHLQRPDIVSWSVPSSFLDMELADVDGDGAEEIVTALDTNCRQLIAYGQDGRVKWDADVAGPANAVAVDPARGRVLCASGAGYVVALDGRTGARSWSCRLGDTPYQVWCAQNGAVLAVCRSGKVFVIGKDGLLRGRDDLDATITALLRPGDHRVSGGPLVLGAADGRALLLHYNALD